MVIFLLIVAALYFFPTPQKEFDATYDFDVTIRTSLSEFRQTPLSSIDVDGAFLFSAKCKLVLSPSSNFFEALTFEES